jgi:HK97 family phage major capsid protein
MTTTEELIRVVNANHQAIVAQADRTSNKLDELYERVRETDQKFESRRGYGEQPTQSLGAEIVASDGYRAFVGQMGGRGSVKIPLKAALTSSSGSAGALIRPDRQSEVVTLPHQKLSVRDLLAPGRTASGVVEYTRVTGFTNSAAAVSEGAEKPESSLTFELVETTVKTIAHWIPVSRQAMDDAAQLQSLLDSEMRYGLRLAEEEQLLFGSGFGPNLNGLAIQATAYSAPFSVESETMLDTLLLAIAQAQQTKLPATGIIVNDLDWKRMQAIKDGEGRYVGGGPFGAQPNVAWTLPVVDTPSMPEGSFLVGAFAMAAQIFDRMDPEVLISSEDRDNFIKNMLTVRAEERLALAVKRPQALIYGDYPFAT